MTALKFYPLSASGSRRFATLTLSKGRQNAMLISESKDGNRRCTVSGAWTVFVFVNGESTDPCITRNIQCKQGQVCRLMKVDCFTSPCSPQPICVDGKIPTLAGVCKINQPIIDGNHKALFCGRGFHRVSCPDDTRCAVDPVDRFAVCCYTGPTGILG
ncbi:hypothetical protein LOTGIDRAFT_228879 [Lottia gigantea]|uniref:Uncharacterized protein n=1 Tax=Lottia gigantea TaxID=225164 RepID=V3ZX21_LOTGI|nr:hypothetical protein LOTGIDRAFT_228879 [Lottia gigantea]ESO88907.1 hypothetical protein LOTGIDRAFT_228879 [Lottia gigantea]